MAMFVHCNGPALDGGCTMGGPAITTGGPAMDSGRTVDGEVHGTPRSALTAGDLSPSRGGRFLLVLLVFLFF